MKPKKNPKKDLNRSSGLYFIIGLSLVLALAYVALEWKTYDNAPIHYTGMNTPDNIDEILPPIILPNTPPTQQLVIPDIIEIVEDEEPIVETIIESTESNENQEIIELEDIVVVDMPDDIEIPINAVEEVPVFPGCENESDKLACFSAMITKHVKKNQRYPEAAQELDIQGRVSVVFVIQKDGSIGNVRMRGPHQVLETEAERIINKLPKMKPGKQGGKPVKVPFSIPITFKLQ
ncbi:MAG: energy transducer TonB [Flavobacteriaceae bacterium]